MKKVKLPDNFVVTSRIIDLAIKNGWPDPVQELEAFKDHHLARGSIMADWEAAFRTWLRNAKRWGSKVQFREATKKVSQPPAKKLPNLTDDQRIENQRRVRELIAGVRKKWEK